MGSNTFSTALFNALCLDLGVTDCPATLRFGDVSEWCCETPDEFARYALLRSAFKKSEQEVDPHAEGKTLWKFTQANKACREWSPPEISNPAIGYSIAYAKLFLKDWLEPHSGTELILDMAAIEERARFGPGRSAGLDSTLPSQYYFKIGDQALTASSDFLLSWYEQSVRLNPLCEAAEMARKARHGRADGKEVSKLSFVPKSYSSRRIVVTEPSVNTFFQLGVGGLMEDALRKSTGIDTAVQQGRNQRLALRGSYDGTFATMDLTQCSDYISQGLVAYMFPSSARKWFNTLRSSSVILPSLGGFPDASKEQRAALEKAREVKLHMTGTMGNGFTFPMQTMLLAAIVLGVYKCLDIKAVYPNGVAAPTRWEGSDGNFGVFGDDIICLKDAFPLIVKVIDALGMRVNLEKSFADGPFRESCGADYFEGVNVRGVYIHHYRTVQDYLSIFNRLAIWSVEHNIPLPRSLRYVARKLGEDRLRYVPPDEQVTSGVILPLPIDGDKDCWVYQRYVPTMSPFFLETWEYIHIEYARGIQPHERCARRRKWLEALERRAERFGSGGLNEPAVLKALLYGAIRRGSIVTRATKLSYKSVVTLSPRWGYTTLPTCHDFSKSQLEQWNCLVLGATTVPASP